ncbi:MAG: hypothetical protein KF822_04740 [Steroidobacteraceae bacterium]|nr:hypothetical protein [Steroidobacteraceae bacterium]
MTTLYTRYTRTIAAALASVVITGLTGLTLDRGHEGALPRGTIEIGELQTLSVGDLVVATLPAVEVIGSRDLLVADKNTSDAGSQG